MHMLQESDGTLQGKRKYSSRITYTVNVGPLLHFAFSGYINFKSVKDSRVIICLKEKSIDED